MSRRSRSITLHVGKDRTPLLRMFIAEARDQGFHFGLAEKGIPNPHLTTLLDDSRMTAHITDRDGNRGTVHPLRQEISREEIASRLAPPARCIRRIAPQTICYIMGRRLQAKLARLLPTEGVDGNYSVPLDFCQSRVVLDFDNRNRWKRITLAKLRHTPPYSGYIRDRNGRILTVYPLEDGRFLCLGPRQHKRIQEEGAKLMGFDMYFEYQREKYGDSYLRLVKERLRSTNERH